MSTIPTSQKSVMALAALILSTQSCMPKKTQSMKDPHSGSKLTSITMPIPESLKKYVSDGKINGYVLEILGGDCASGSKGTTIPGKANTLSADDKIANEKLQKNCDYTVTLSLGKMGSANTLEKTYLTNNLKDHITKVPRDATNSSKIKINVKLVVTEDGIKDLGFNSTTVDIPSSSEVDANIDVSVIKPTQSPTPSTSNYDWRKTIVWTKANEYAYSGNTYGSAYYKDIMTHTPAEQRYLEDQGRSTQAHESLHGLVSIMRNLSPADDGYFFFENGQGAYVLQPKKLMAKVKDYIAPNFRAETQSRYDLYLVQQAKSWTEILYLFDEWNGYVATSKTALELNASGQWDDKNSDPFDGLADFLYFCSASVLTLKDLDSAYLSTNQQFKAVFAMLAEQSATLINSGSKIEKWKNTNGLKRLKMLQNDAENEKIRTTLKEFLGADWTKEKLGF